jgi:hypothetical protein
MLGISQRVIDALNGSYGARRQSAWGRLGKFSFRPEARAVRADRVLPGSGHFETFDTARRAVDNLPDEVANGDMYTSAKGTVTVCPDLAASLYPACKINRSRICWLDKTQSLITSAAW